MPRHVLSPCYAHYEHIRGIKGYKGVCNILFSMLCEVISAKHVVLYEITNAKMHGCHLRKYGWGKWADWKKKKHRSIFVLTTLISFGMFNIFCLKWA
jgi:hypothetical protein